MICNLETIFRLGLGALPSIYLFMKRIWKRSELKPLLNKINKVCDELNNTYNINLGGCCYVAACIAEEFDSLNIPYSLAIYPDVEICCPNNYIREHIISRDSNCITLGDDVVCHYALKLSHVGIVNIDDREEEDYILIKNISAKDIMFVYKSGSWNSCYHTKYNKLVKDKLHEIFKILGTSLP